MPQPYRGWCAQFTGNTRGHCAQRTLDMVAAFPELTRVRGHVGKVSPDTEHWWCVAPDGTIIDPTAAQFRIGSVYIPFRESEEEPAGVCVNCGGYRFNGLDSVCSAECQREYLAYLANPAV